MKSRHHKIKLLKEYVPLVVSGKKSFDIRRNDKDYKVGDTVEFLPVENSHGETVRIHMSEIEGKIYQIDYLTTFGLQEGYVAFSIKEI